MPQDPTESQDDLNLFDFSRAPLTGGFVLLLILIYLFSAFPGFLYPNPGYLAWANLDIQAVLERQEYWRLITANLSHASLPHLAGNIFAILIFGMLLEHRIGSRQLFWWMLASLALCDLFSIAFAVSRSIGASGIAYGLQTGFIVLAGKIMMIEKHQPIGRTLHSLLGYILLMVLVNVFSGGHLNIYGHLGGAMAGLICAVVYRVQ